MFLNKCFLTTGLVLVLTAPAMAAKKDIPTIRPCTETVTENCKAIPPLDPNQRAQQAPQPQQASPPVAPPPPQAQQQQPVAPVAVPQPARPENGVQIYIDKSGITIPGFLRVGPEGFRVGPIVVTNPNYHPPVPALGYAPSGPGGR